MRPSILNREFKHPSDGWYQIEPTGEHPNRVAGVVQVIDSEATAAIVNRFNSQADAGELSHGHEMLIDHEHFSHDASKETRAFGWLTRLQNRVDGIYGQIRWTDTGKAAVDGGDYRFFSTEYNQEDLVVLNRSGAPKRVRPSALGGLTLTNRPNNKGGKPITNKQNTLPDSQANSPAGAQADPASSPTTPGQVKTNRNKMKLIASKLGLSADASEEVILGELDKLFNRAGTVTTITAERDTLKNRVTELEKNLETIQGEVCDALMDAHGIKADDKVRNRLRPTLAALKNREERIEALADFGFKPVEAQPEKRDAQTKLLNRSGNAPGNGKGSNPGSGKDEAKQAQAIMNRAREIQKELKGMSDASAVAMAQRELTAA